MSEAGRFNPLGIYSLPEENKGEGIMILYLIFFSLNPINVNAS